MNSIHKLVLIGLLILSIIIAIGGSECGSKSKKKSNTGSSVTDIVRIIAPSNLTANAIYYTQINLNWSDNSANETGFEIWRSLTDTSNYSLLTTIESNLTTWADTTITETTTYYYKIRGYTLYGDYSYFSNDASASNVFNWAWVPTAWAGIGAGGQHTIALATDGFVWSWGYNADGQLGLGFSSLENQLVPALIRSDWDWGVFNNVSTPTCGYLFSFAIKPDPSGGGTLWSWGANGYGQLGQGNDETPTAPDNAGTDSDCQALIVAGIWLSALKQIIHYGLGGAMIQVNWD